MTDLLGPDSSRRGLLVTPFLFLQKYVLSKDDYSAPYLATRVRFLLPRSLPTRARNFLSRSYRRRVQLGVRPRRTERAEMQRGICRWSKFNRGSRKRKRRAVSNPFCSPRFRVSGSGRSQQAAFAFGVPHDINGFHPYTVRSACLSPPPAELSPWRFHRWAVGFNQGRTRPPTRSLRPINPDNA